MTELFPKVTIGEELWDKMCAMKKEGGLTKDTGVKALNDLVEQHVKGLRGTVKLKKPERVELFNALVAAEGGDLTGITKTHQRAIAVALNEILAVKADLTPADIERAANAYKKRNRDVKLTSNGLAKQWSLLGMGKPTEAAKKDPYIEPTFDWRAWAEKNWHVNLDGPWGDVSIALRSDILRLAS